MSRYDTSSFDFGNHIDYRDDIDHEQGSPVNKSFNSGISGTSSLHTTASSSKAVLAALRALQDKIRRLEIERSQALDEASQLRNQLKSQEIEIEHAKERELLHSQKNMQEVRAAYDRAMREKEDAENEVRNLEARNNESQKQILELTAQIKELENIKIENTNRIKEINHQIALHENQLQLAQQREKELSSAMIWETKRHEEEVKNLKAELFKLNQELSQASMLKIENQTKLIELDHLVGQLLSINESLVKQLSTVESSQKRGRLTVSKSTVAASGASSTKKRSSSSSKIPRAASLSTESQTIRENSVAKQFQRRDDTNDSNPALERLKGMHDMYAKLAKTILGKEVKVEGENKKKVVKKKKETAMKQRSKQKEKSSSQESYDLSQFESKYFHPSQTLDLSSPTSEEIMQPAQSPQVDFKAIITSLEEEFESLNSQYQSILSAAGDPNTNRSEQLVNIIQKLHKKGEQLRALKSPKSSGNEISLNFE